jgi:hypothetical protein
MEDSSILADEIYQITDELMKEGHKPFAIAAIYSMIAMQIYKTTMSEDEYNSMIDFISNNRDKVKRLVDSSVIFGQSGSVH